MADDIGELLRHDFKAVDKRDEVHSVMGWLRGDTEKVPLVVDDGRPFGIVNDRAMMGRRLDHKAKVEGYTLPTRALPVTAPLGEAMERMREFRAAFLPVEDERGHLAGYVSSLDVARGAGLDARASELALPISTLRDDQTVGDALSLLMREYIDVLPVLDAQGQPRGVLHRRAVLHLAAEASDKGRKDAVGNKLRSLDIPVSGIMEETAIFIDGGAPFHEVVAKLEKFGYALVRENGKLVGIVTPETLFRARR